MPTHRPSSLFTWGEVGSVGTWRGGVPNPFRICKCIDKSMFVLCQWVETSGKHGLIGETQISGSVCCRHGYNGLFNWCYGSIPPEPIVGKSMPQVGEIVVFTCFTSLFEANTSQFSLLSEVLGATLMVAGLPRKHYNSTSRWPGAVAASKMIFAKGPGAVPVASRFGLEKIQELPALPAFSIKSSDFLFA